LCFIKQCQHRYKKFNIFYNARSNSGATSNHYAIATASGGTITIDYNNYYVSGSGGVIGNFGGTDEATLADWQVATGQDDHSLNTNPGFANAGGTLPYNYIPSATLTGVTGTVITTDY
jgi:hypothetical protein